MKTLQTPELKLKKLIETLAKESSYFGLMKGPELKHFPYARRPDYMKPGYAILNLKPEERILLNTSTSSDFVGLRLEGITTPWPTEEQEKQLIVRKKP